MPPPATAVARRAPARSAPRPQSPDRSPRRPPLRLFEPVRRHRAPARPARRSAFVWLSGLVVVGSLLAVVAGDALLAEGQVRLSALQTRVAAATAEQKSLQVAVSEKAAPPVVVGQAEAGGLVAPTQVVYLPQVPLGVPLPAPSTTPLTPRPATVTAGR